MKRRGSQGFTMLETIIVVALLGIIGGLVVGNLIDLIRGAYHREMEEIAKELYVAAEHHLSVASSNHKLEKLPEGKRGTKDEDAVMEESLDGVYYYVVGDGSPHKTLLTDDQSVLYAMLPPGAIDETIRSGGSYVIRYQYLDEQATLLDVFYASPTGRYGRFGHSFSVDEDNREYKSLIYEPGYRGDSRYDARANYGEKGAVIGWYDGASGSNSANRLRPRISVENAERLTVSLDNWRSIVGLSDEYTLYLEVKGETSKASITIADPFTKMIRAVRQGENYYTYSFDLDSIADPGSHFVELSEKSTVVGSFIPGENLNVKVRLVRTIGSTTNSGESGGDASEGAEPVGEKTVETHSPIIKCNSLFAELVPVSAAEGEGGAGGSSGEAASGYIAKISNIRHLENIGTNISGYKDASANGLKIIGFEQTADLSWTSFRKRIKGLSDDNADTGESRKVVVYDRTSAAAAASAEGCFMPINPDGAVNYDGKGYKISDVIVENKSGESSFNAGLFGELPKGSTLSDMELVDFDITTTSGNAGALAGVAKQGTKITGVIAHNTPATERAGENATDSQLQEAITEEAALEVRGTLAVGGLVGSLESAEGQASSIERSAAAVYVKSAGTSTTTASVAGGLVGSVTGPAKIETSYAAGHTLDGLYADEDGDEAIGRYNVQAAGAAGGLVGSTTGGVTISKSYATTSVLGATAGGLAGTLSGASVDGCYATGRVKGTAAKGSFAGSTSNGTSFTLDASNKPTNYVLDIVNNLTTASSGTDDSTVPLVGTDTTTTAIGKIDDTAETYDAFVKATSDAAPYDNSLPSFYGLATVAELADLKPEDEASTDGSAPAATPAPGSDGATPVAESAGDDETTSDKEKGWFLFEHVGDWPLVETEVVNKKSGLGA